ncbi:MAG: hypothetical protein WEE89_23090 [Gemmatimonadota bacterium]
MIASIGNSLKRCATALALLLVVQPAAAQKQGDDSVLRALVGGTRAFALGHDREAAGYFDVAVDAISAIWGASPQSADARSLWYEEAVKPFKGDPYERMMAFYYRGLVFLKQHDFGNAQAAFRMSVQQDAFAEEEQNNYDAVLPLFLQGWALQQQGSSVGAREAFRMVRELRPDFPVDDPTITAANTVVVVETGNGPRKVADGVGSYKLRFFRGKNFQEARATVRLPDGRQVPLYPIEDVYWQATSRGGRQVDYIFEGKARFAERNENIGSALSVAASDLAIRKYQHDGKAGDGMSKAADALSVLSIGALALSARAKPAVDTRYWDNLPDAVHIAVLDLPPGQHTLGLSFTSATGAALPELDRTVQLTIPPAPGKPALVWASSRDRTSRYVLKARN